jgi:hypothetical protein
MSSVRIIDTTVLCNLLGVPNMDQDAARARAEFQQAVEAEDRILLPIAVIYETGNHIAQNGDGSTRRKIASSFVDLLQKAFTGKLPFTPTPLQNPEDLLEWLGEFPDSAMRGMGFGDLSITKVFHQQCALNRGRRVLIWSYDQHLQGFERAPAF